jgi:16S rRNA (cytosine1407-C5)-methyltransferase
LPSNPYEEEIAEWSEKVFEGDITLSDESARKYLKGESISLSGDDALKRGPHRVLWKGYAIGLGKAVGDRLNNGLPRILRGIESSL